VPHRDSSADAYDRGMSALTDELQRVRLFEGLSQRHLRQLGKLVKEREFGPGVKVLEEGTMSGICFFIVSEGEASVSVEGTEVARIGPGDYFGELALITEDARSATVTAVTPLRCLSIAFWDFRKFAKDNPDVTWKLLQHVARLLVAERHRRARASLSLAAVA
jgi:CRP-like cAMP-binding protein